MGVGRVVMALELEEIDLPINDTIDAYVMYVNEEEKVFASKLLQDLRMNGFKVDTEYTGRSLKSQFKQADRMNSKFYILLNSEDIKNNQVKIRNASTKEEELVDIDYIIYYLDEALKYQDEYATYEGFEFEEKSCNCKDDCDCGCDHDHECQCNHHED